jgi:hypothetical protein
MAAGLTAANVAGQANSTCVNDFLIMRINIDTQGFTTLALDHHADR